MRRIRRDRDVLDFARGRVGRPADRVDEDAAGRQERLDRVAPQVRVEGHRVRAESVDDGCGLAGCRGANVAALGIDQYRDISRDARAQPLQRGDAGRPECLVEREVRLHVGRIRQRRVEEEPGEPLDPRDVRCEPPRKTGGIGVQAQAEGRVDGPRPGGEAFEVARAHGEAVPLDPAAPLPDPATDPAAPDGDAPVVEGPGVGTGRSAGAMYQPGRDDPSRPLYCVRSIGSPGVQLGARPFSGIACRSTI